MNEDSTEDIVIKSQDSHNLQRPETVESLFIMWRLTKDETYRQWGWEIFKAFMEHSVVEGGGGFTSLDTVLTVPPRQRDNMESFWLVCLLPLPHFSSFVPFLVMLITFLYDSSFFLHRPKLSNTSTCYSQMTRFSLSQKLCSILKPTHSLNLIQSHNSRLDGQDCRGSHIALVVNSS